MKTTKLVFITLALILSVGLAFSLENSSSPATSLNESRSAGNQSSPSIDQNTSSPSDEGNTSSPSICGELIYFCSENSPYCKLVRPEIDKFIQDSGCVEVTEHIIPDFMNLIKDTLALKYNVDHVPAFIFVDDNNCFGEIGKQGWTKLEDIKNGIANFNCGGNTSSPSNPLPPVPECPTYTCEGGFKPKCEILNNQCSCESCPSIPIEPNLTSGPIEIPVVENPQTVRYECGGCELDKKCYPFGFRKDKNYCDDITSKFISEKVPKTSCENNFECDSNLCIDNKCFSGSLWAKFLRWLNRLFGDG